MRIAVFGAGGTGGYFGGRLAAAGHEVHFIARGDHLARIRREGLQIRSPLGDLRIHPANAGDQPGDIGPVDAVIVGVKAWQVPAAAAAMHPLIGPETAVLPLQNGVEAADQLTAELGPNHVLGGTSRIISYIAEPGVVQHIGGEPFIELGELDNRISARATALVDALRSAGVKTEIPEHIGAAIWQKFIFITAISGVGAVTRLPFGLFRDIPEARRLYDGALDEVAYVALARKVPISMEYVESLVGFLDRLPADGTASMQRDMIDGRPSELEAQTGAVVRFAEELGVAVPINRFIYAALLPQERQAREHVRLARKE